MNSLLTLHSCLVTSGKVQLGHPSPQDDVTVRDLAVRDISGDVKGWLQHIHAWLFHGDIFASVASSDTLMRIHGTAEELDPAAEECFTPFQVQKP